MDAAIVSVHGVRVGQLDRSSEHQDFVFHFERDWLDDPTRPALGQLFEDRKPDPIATSGLPCWFAHLLPQGPWRRYLQRAAGLDELENDDFDILVAMGSDLPGAVTLSPAVPRLLGPGGYAADEGTAGALRFSLAGAQTKLSVRAGERGLVVPVHGTVGSFIAKFHDPEYPELPRLELATTRWARLAGIRTHVVRLAHVDEFRDLPAGLPCGDGRVLLAERFDRVADGLVHAEDFGQLLDRPPGPRQYQGSYEEVGAVLAALAPEDVSEYVDRLVFMAICGNGDAHLKNWGVVYPDRRRPRLGPAYDLVATIARNSKDDLALTLNGDRDFANVGLASFHPLARVIGMDAGAMDTLVLAARDRALDAWSSAGAHLELSEAECRRIDVHIRRVPLCR